MITEEKIKAAAVMVSCVAEAIREAGPIPSGVLYSALMGHMDLATYSRMIVLLKDSGLVKESNYLLAWVEPKVEAQATPTATPEQLAHLKIDPVSGPNPNAGVKRAYPKGRW